MLINSFFVGGKCRLNCPDCPYKSEILQPDNWQPKRSLLDFFYGGDVLEELDIIEKVKNLNSKKIIQTTALSIAEEKFDLSFFDAVILAQILDFQDSLANVGRDIVVQTKKSLEILKNKKIIWVVQVNDLNISSLIDNYYLAGNSFLVLNISDVTLSCEEKAYLRYLTKKKNVVASQRILGTCCYTPGFVINHREIVNILKLLRFLFNY